MRDVICQKIIDTLAEPARPLSCGGCSRVFDQSTLKWLLLIAQDTMGTPMPPSRALQHHRDAVRRLIEKSCVRNLRVFGSVLSGKDHEGSDLDLLVDPMPGTTLFDLGGLQVALEDLLGVPVDLLTPQDLPARYREKVLRESAPV